MNYVQIIRNVLKNGVPKQATRYDSNGNVIPVENGTIGTFCEIFEHDMSQGFPLTTIRKMPWRSIRVELEGFIKGITDKKWYQDRKCGFWNEWSNPIEVDNFIKYSSDMFPNEAFDENGEVKRKWVQENLMDLGPIYGYQWRKFGQHYNFSEEEFYDTYKEAPNGVYEGRDKLKDIVSKLKNSPYDRRMVCSAWNPNQMNMMALPPCHWAWNVVVYGDKLNLVWHQRSCDLLLGVGSNIASYGLLMMLLCEESGLKPGKLMGTLADCHIYQNHMEAAKILADREEVELPELYIKYYQEPYPEEPSFSIYDWEYDQVELVNYNPLPPVVVGKVTV